tara:strand:- start:988 stop:1131 length:144 start_codon:yes stop_codon:yes gene_type:complete
MKNKKSNKLSETKSLLVNMLYHVGFNKEGIENLSGVSSKDIKKYIKK